MNCIVDAWARYEAELRGYLARHLKDARQSEDLLQDIFVKAIHQGKGFCELDNPRAWLFRVARNQLADYYRRDRNYDQLSDDIADPEEEIPAVETLSECLPRALENLDCEDREAISRCDLQGMSQLDYAQLKCLTLPAVKSRIQRARKRLKSQLQTQCQIRFDDSSSVCCYVPVAGRVEIKSN